MNTLNKDIGIIGGAGPEAGLLLAKYIVKISQEKYACQRDQDFPYLALWSFPFSEMLKDPLHEQVTSELHKLIQHECTQTKFWAIACNTLHCFLDERPLPNTFVHLLKECAKFISEKPLVLSSSTSKKYQLHKKYFDCDYLSNKFQPKMDELIDDLVAHEPTLEMYETFLTIVKQLGDRQIVLGCTELSLLTDAFKDTNPAFIDPLNICATKLCALHFEAKYANSLS